MRGLSTSNETRSWRDSKAQSLMVLSCEALARIAQSNESAKPVIVWACSKGAPTASSVDASNSQIVLCSSKSSPKLNAAMMLLSFAVQNTVHRKRRRYCGVSPTFDPMSVPRYPKPQGNFQHLTSLQASCNLARIELSPPSYQHTRVDQPRVCQCLNPISARYDRRTRSPTGCCLQRHQCR